MDRYRLSASCWRPETCVGTVIPVFFLCSRDASSFSNAAVSSWPELKRTWTPALIREDNVLS